MTMTWANPLRLPTSRLVPRVGFGASRRHMLVHDVVAARAVWRNGRLTAQAEWRCGDGGYDVVLLADPADGGSRCVRCTDVAAGPAVYRCYDAEGRLLYIGSTSRLEMRLAQHRATTAWWPTVARVEPERFASIIQARTAEARAIREERPLHNKVGRLHRQFHEVPA